MLVVDASAAVNACLSEAGFAPIAGRRPVSTPLMWSESSSVIHEMLWRGAISRELAAIAVSRLIGAPVARRSPGKLVHEAWRIADELGWARTYDAEYVALARLLGARLLTVDGRLLRGASRVVEVIGPADL